jgi:hypothetical protein
MPVTVLTSVPNSELRLWLMFCTSELPEGTRSDRKEIDLSWVSADWTSAGPCACRLDISETTAGATILPARPTDANNAM